MPPVQIDLIVFRQTEPLDHPPAEGDGRAGNRCRMLAARAFPARLCTDVTPARRKRAQHVLDPQHTAAGERIARIVALLGVGEAQAGIGRRSNRSAAGPAPGGKKARGRRAPSPATKAAGGAYGRLDHWPRKRARSAPPSARASAPRAASLLPLDDPCKRRLEPEHWLPPEARPGL